MSRNPNFFHENKVADENEEKEFIPANVFTAVQKGISHYLTKENKATFATIKSKEISGEILVYNYGHHRAQCFFDIIESACFLDKFRMFAVFTLLNENNGYILKQNVKADLLADLGKSWPEKLNKYIEKEYPELQIRNALQKQLLKLIHNKYNDHSGHKNIRSGTWLKGVADLSNSTQTNSTPPENKSGCCVM